MTMFRRFTDKKLDSLRARYRGDDLFRIWVPVLCLQEQQHAELNAVEVWSEAEEICRQLADISEHRDTEAEFLLTRLTDRHTAWQQAEGSGVTLRGKEPGLRTALLILTVLFTQLADASPDTAPDAADRNPHRALCRVLARILTNPCYREFAARLLGTLRRRKQDNEGRPIVLPVADYLDCRNPIEQMDLEARRQVEQMVEEISRQTIGIRSSLCISWEAYVNIWRQLCADHELLELLARRQPRSVQNTWGKNWTLVANVIGIMKETPCANGGTMIAGSNQQLSAKLGINVRSYLTCHADYSSSNTPLTRQQHERIKGLIVASYKLQATSEF